MKQAIIILIMTTAFIFSCGTGKAPQNPNNSSDNPGQTNQSDSDTKNPEHNNNSAIAPPAYDPDNPVGGNINSKEPIAYADREFLRGIIDYDSIATIEPPQNWPELLDNSFHIDYNSGEMRMVRPEMVLGVAEALGIETEYQADYLDIPNCDFRLYALYVQKVKNEVYFKTLYNYEDKIPEYLAVYKKLENDSVANRKDLAIQRCYRLTQDGLVLMLDYYFNNYIFKRPEDPMTGPLKTVDNISDYIKQVYGNVAVKDNKYLTPSFINSIKVKNNTLKWRTGTDLFLVKKALNYQIYRNPNTIMSNNDYLDQYILIRDLPDLYANDTGPLLDNKNIFKYSFDKMIDGNPGTSYVENSSNDMIHFTVAFPGKTLTITAISIVNGYALNEDFYFKNNRIKQVKLILKGYKTERKEIINLQETLEPQVFEFTSFALSAIELVTNDIYKGTKWNDTCLAEINFLTEDGWIF